MASTLDLLPTIMKLVGVEPVKGVTLDGHDMRPILFDKKQVTKVDDAVWPVVPTLTPPCLSVAANVQNVFSDGLISMYPLNSFHDFYNCQKEIYNASCCLA